MLTELPSSARVIDILDQAHVDRGNPCDLVVLALGDLIVKVHQLFAETLDLDALPCVDWDARLRTLLNQLSMVLRRFVHHEIIVGPDWFRLLTLVHFHRRGSDEV
jgi:hypothetical protein